MLRSIVWGLALLSALPQGGALAVVDEILPAETALWAECEFGDFTADALQYDCGTDAAFVNGGLFGLNLQSGELDAEDLALYYGEDAPIGRATLSYAELYDMLERSVSRVSQIPDGSIDGGASAFEGYLQLAGLRFTWDASAPAGERVVAVYDGRGELLERDEDAGTLSVAAPVAVLRGEYGYADLGGRAEECGRLFASVGRYAEQLGHIAAPAAGRVSTLSANENRIIDRVPMLLIVALMVFCVLLRAPKYLSMQKKTRR